MRKNRNKVFIILYFSATWSQRRAEKHQRAVDPLPAGQTFDSTGSPLCQSPPIDCARSVALLPIQNTEGQLALKNDAAQTASVTMS